MFSPIIWIWFTKGWKRKNNIQEIIKRHVEQGAKEFFCWYNPPYWHNKFWFEVSPNMRFSEHEQVSDFESLKEIVNEVHKYWKKIMWNINHRYYTDVVENELKQIIDDFINVWIDGFIVSSMWILEYLEEISQWKWEHWYIINWKKIYLNISTIMCVYNTESILYLKENYPIYKIILPRELTLSEIENIVNTFPNLLFEVFWEWDFCRYNNWLCFAEHKYTDRDICTMVVNNLIIKKSINYDFRKIIKDDKVPNNEKAKQFDNTYISEFDQLKDSMDNIMVGEVTDLIKKIVWKYILFYDPLQWLRTKHNQNFKTVLKAVRFLKQHKIVLNNLPYFESLDNLLNYLETEEKLWKEQYLKNLKEIVGEKFGVIAKYKDWLYNRADNLNLYSYVFFDKFNNLDTVKFPTRWRNYLPKLKLIENCINDENNILANLDMNCSFERAHYDLKYLFWNDKYWFYKIRQNLHKVC